MLVDSGSSSAGLHSSEAGRLPSSGVTLKVNEVHYALSLVSGPEEALSCSYSLDR